MPSRYLWQFVVSYGRKALPMTGCCYLCPFDVPHARSLLPMIFYTFRASNRRKLQVASRTHKR